MAENTEEAEGNVGGMNLAERYLREQRAIVQGRELLQFLDPETEESNTENALANVKSDLQYLESVANQEFSVIYDNEDLALAFRNKYGDGPEAFPGDFPDDVARLIDLRSNMMHLILWKFLRSPDDDEYISKRDSLKDSFTEAISRWFQQTPPFSINEVSETFEILRTEYVSLYFLIYEEKVYARSQWYCNPPKPVRRGICERDLCG